MSLDPPSDDDDSPTLCDSLGAGDDGFRRVEHALDFEHRLECLGTRERQVFRLRFNENLTQREIGERLGLTQMSVSRLLKRCLPQLTEIGT